jgi:hypothetical protein
MATGSHRHARLLSSFASDEDASGAPVSASGMPARGYPGAMRRAVAKTFRSPAVRIFLWSRAAIWLGALLALAVLEPAWFHDPGAIVDFRDPGDIIGIWARWDSYWFLAVAEHGYSGGEEAAFFPLYPGAIASLGRVLAAQYVLAGLLVSLAACLGSFALLYRLAETRLGTDGARRAVLYLAIFPMTLFLQAVYSEALYLLLTLAAFLLAERRRFLGAGIAAGLALLTRAAGVALLPALALLAWRGPNRARSLAALAIAPALFAAYPLLLWQQTGDALGFLHAEGRWNRQLSPTGPFGVIWDGLRAGWTGARVLWTALSSDATEPLRPHMTDIEYVAFLVLFMGLTVVAWRRFGAPYGVFAVCSLALPLLLPASNKPLLSLPRFGLAVFPFFLALAALGGRPRAHRSIVALSAVLLGLTIIDWTFWQWVS